MAAMGSLLKEITQLVILIKTNEDSVWTVMIARGDSHSSPSVSHRDAFNITATSRDICNIWNTHSHGCHFSVIMARNRKNSALFKLYFTTFWF